VGGSESVPLNIQIIPEFPTIKSGRVMGISFTVTYRGAPIEGAFINIDVDFGNLSQQGASTFPDGTQRIKYTAPKVGENTTITVHASVSKFGYPEGESWAQFNVEPSSSYGKLSTSSMFSLAQYWVYIVVLVTLIAVNVAIVIIGAKKRRQAINMTKTGKGDGD